MRQPTLEVVAKACGVSASTVSRAFSRPGVVNADVRQRILQTAAQLNFYPNRSARGLATGTSGRIGLLVPDVTNPFFAELVRVVQHVAWSMWERSVLIVDSSESSMKEPDMLAQIAAEVDGVILAAPRAPTRSLRDVLARLPCVVVNRKIVGSSSVLCDNTAALIAHGNALVALGHRTVAVIRGPSGAWAARQRASALDRWARSARVELVMLDPCPATFEGGRDAVGAVVDSGATAVFAYDDLVACGVVSGLHEAGRRVPDDVSVIGCDDAIVARILTPALSTIRAPYAQMASTALELLDAQRTARRASPSSVTVEGLCVMRDSTAVRRT